MTWVENLLDISAGEGIINKQNDKYLIQYIKER